MKIKLTEADLDANERGRLHHFEQRSGGGQISREASNVVHLGRRPSLIDHPGLSNACSGACDEGERCDCDVLLAQMPGQPARMWDPLASNAVQRFPRPSLLQRLRGWLRRLF